MPATSVTHVPDLKGKLEYLLHNRGGDMLGWRHRITTQRLLAEALTELGTNTDEPTIARWKRPDDIPNLVHIAPKIARIFRCDELSFRRDDLATFMEKTDGTAPSWNILVANAEIAGTIGPTAPPAQAIDAGLHAMVAYPIDVDLNDDEPLPELTPGARFNAVLPFPVVRTDPVPCPLSVLLFSGDRDGYLNWLPRYRHSKAFKGLERVVPGQEIRLPSFGGQLKVDEQSDGKHDIVLVVAAAEMPTAVQAGLEAAVVNTGLLPALELLARWLSPLLQDGRAAMRRRPYYVRA